MRQPIHHVSFYFPRLIKNRGRGLPPALTTAAAARHTRTGAGSGGPPGHAAALFSAVHENPPFRDHPKMVYVKVLQKQAKPDLKTEKVSDGTVRAGVRSLVTVVTGTLGGASQNHARQKSSPS